LTFAPIVNSNYVNIYAMNVTERKWIEEERENLIAKLEAQNAELERFTYTVSHDLKSPLITIRGHLGLLQEDLAEGSEEQVAGDMARIAAAADKMHSLLQEVLELSRIGRVVNPPEDVPLQDIVREATELVSGKIAERGVQVTISPDLPILYGDHTRLREVLQNLIENAVAHMGEQPKPHIAIGARQNDGETVCYVSDNGAGIDPLYHERIFRLFEKLDSKSDGTGIGLALVKRIIEVHGGRVWVESGGIGHGSTFCFTLPPREQAPTPAV
jgi:signal transduction histidine kinase